MNEYIVHGVNGLLYDLRSPRPVDFSDAARLGEDARRGAIAGRARWEEVEEKLVEFILAPSAELAGDPPRTAPATKVDGTTAVRRGVASTVVEAARSLARTARGMVRRRILD
jgi:hypothetical protein